MKSDSPPAPMHDALAPGQEGIDLIRRHWVYRHSLVVRLTHWFVAFCLAVLLMSGLQIFNAHPALYWGPQSTFDTPAFKIEAVDGDGGTRKGVTTLAGHAFTTTGVLGVSTSVTGQPEELAFPSWITLPGTQNLAVGRRWHFFFAWLLVLGGLVYVIHGLFSRHIWRDLLPSRGELRRLPHSVWDHVRLRFPEGDEARRYNVLQKLTYLTVLFIVLPALVLAGWAMSPGLDTAFPQLPALFGGRQSARTVHFIAAAALVLFVVVHVVEVLISGVVNNLRSMLTGRYDIERSTKSDEQSATS